MSVAKIKRRFIVLNVLKVKNKNENGCFDRLHNPKNFDNHCFMRKLLLAVFYIKSAICH